MMRTHARRVVLAAGLAGGLLAVPLAATAQPAVKIHRIGFLAYTEPAETNSGFTAFRQGLRDLGWIDGKNVAIEYRWAEGRAERLPDLAAELVRLKVDVILAATTTAAVAAKKATSTVPIVMATASDPEALGLVASLARPGGNVTGLSFGVGLGSISKQLELLREALPGVVRVAVLSNPANPAQPLFVREVKDAARSLGVQARFLEARGPEDLDGAFARMARERAGALLVISDPVFYRYRERLRDLAARNRLPAMYGIRVYPEAGGLMSYGIDNRDNFRRSTAYVDKMLKGAMPADLPVEQPTKFELVINLKTARALGLTIPPAMLARADQVIE